jgi:cellulose synthase/poly-beta-1,6-N-acetylglucosamine synthase-like glycosyltransferase
MDLILLRNILNKGISEEFRVWVYDVGMTTLTSEMIEEYNISDKYSIGDEFKILCIEVKLKREVQEKFFKKLKVKDPMEKINIKLEKKILFNKGINEVVNMIKKEFLILYDVKEDNSITACFDFDTYQMKYMKKLHNF